MGYPNLKLAEEKAKRLSIKLNKPIFVIYEPVDEFDSCGYYVATEEDLDTWYAGYHEDQIKAAYDRGEWID